VEIKTYNKKQCSHRNVGPLSQYADVATEVFCRVFVAKGTLHHFICYFYLAFTFVHYKLRSVNLFIRRRWWWWWWLVCRVIRENLLIVSEGFEVIPAILVIVVFLWVMPVSHCSEYRTVNALYVFCTLLLVITPDAVRWPAWDAAVKSLEVLILTA